VVVEMHQLPGVTGTLAQPRGQVAVNGVLPESSLSGRCQEA
jgi:hypothetical protein